MEYFANEVLAQFNCAGILWNGEVGAYELFDSVGHTIDFISYDEMQCAISDYEENELAKDMYKEVCLLKGLQSSMQKKSMVTRKRLLKCVLLQKQTL